jgi:membrane-bound ClpP family serine protease
MEVPAQFTSPQVMAVADLGLLLLQVAEIMVILMILLGSAGRIAALTGLILAGIEYLAFGLSAQLIMIAVIETALLYLGTGGYSLWKPEDRLIYRRAGERPPAATAEQTRAIGSVYGSSPEYASENA